MDVERWFFIFQQESRRHGSWKRAASATSNYYQTSTVGRRGFSSAQSSPLQPQRNFFAGAPTTTTGF